MNANSKSILEKLKLELSFKLGMRILIAIVIGIPTLPILYVIFAILKLEVITVISFPFVLLFGLITNNKEATQLVIHAAKMILFVLIAPFLFWAYYLIGCNPIIELEMNNQIDMKRKTNKILTTLSIIGIVIFTCVAIKVIDVQLTNELALVGAGAIILTSLKLFTL